MIRFCNGHDPTLTTVDGIRGRCGRTVDDLTQSPACPHEVVTPEAGVITNLITLPTAVLRRFSLHASREGSVVQCQTCTAEPVAVSPVPGWAIVRSVPDLLLWIAYHEAAVPHISSPAAGRHEAAVPWTSDEITGLIDDQLATVTPIESPSVGLARPYVARADDTAVFVTRSERSGDAIATG